MGLVIFSIIAIPLGVFLIIKGKTWFTGGVIDVPVMNEHGSGRGQLPVPGLKTVGVILILFGLVVLISKIKGA